MKGFELHLGGQNIDFRIQQQNYRQVLGNSIPEGLKISLHWWTTSGTENIHPRFVLTDIGGLHFDHGTDPGHGTSIVHLLNRTRWQEELQRYQSGTTDLDPCGSLVL